MTTSTPRDPLGLLTQIVRFSLSLGLEEITTEREINAAASVVAQYLYEVGKVDAFLAEAVRASTDRVLNHFAAIYFRARAERHPSSIKRLDSADLDRLHRLVMTEFTDERALVVPAIKTGAALEEIGGVNYNAKVNLLIKWADGEGLLENLLVRFNECKPNGAQAEFLETYRQKYLAVQKKPLIIKPDPAWAKRLRNVLGRLPTTASSQGRSALLAGLDVRYLNRYEGNPVTDIGFIVDGILQCESRDIVGVIDNALGFAGEGSQLAYELQTLRREIVID